MMRLIAYGILVDDIVFPDGRTQMDVLGGGGPQTAWGAAAALGSGEQVGLVAGVGQDVAELDLTPLINAQINLEGLRETEHPTPRAWQILEYDGSRRHLWRVPPETLPAQLERGRAVLPTAYTDAAVFHWGIHPGDADADVRWVQGFERQRVSLEPFQPPPQPLHSEALRELVGPLLLFSATDYEARAMVGVNDDVAVLSAFRKTGCRYFAYRRGEQGADVWDLHNGTGIFVPPAPATVVDPVGAGNAFTGALLAQLERGLPEAASHASTAASYMIEQVGMPAGLPDRADYRQRFEAVKARSKPLQFNP